VQQINELAERLASEVLRADPSDPANLAAIHTDFEALSRLLGQADPAASPWSAEAGSASLGAQKALENLILGDAPDPLAALDQVRRSLSELQHLLNGTTAPESLPVATTPPLNPEPLNPEPSDDPGSTTFTPDDLPLVREFIGEAASHIESAEAAVLQLEEDPQNCETINAVFRSFHTIKGVAGFLNLKQIGQLSHAAENLLDLARKNQLELTAEAIDVVLRAIDQMKALVAELDDAVRAERPLRQDPALPSLLHRIHDCATNKPKSVEAQQSVPVQEQGTGNREPETPSSNPQSASRNPQSETSVKVATDRLDALINMVGELVIAESMVRQGLKAAAADDQRLARNVSHLGKITRELQDLSMSMRMIPIQGVFQKMARLVRDTARKAGKEVELTVVGGETELDRNVVEAISDPLVHMVRNSVDHGIEPADDRQRVGKPRTGNVTLKAYHHSGNIVIEIVDDGRGLNTERILAKARAAGIVREGQELTESETFALIFHAGLSTAEKITDISGRGVGMDVVKRNIESLRGQIDIASSPGKGSTFTIRLPLTLAVIDGLAVRVGSQRYILPITSVEQSLRPTAEQLSTVQERVEMCMIRNRLMPLVRLHRLFSVPAATEDPTQSIVVIVQDNHRRCCLLVDELLGQQQVVIKSLGNDIGRVPGVSGGAILGDGNVSLILDVPGLIDISSET
jgi:two-component system chemotaxis sensor kinase CheA